MTKLINRVNPTDAVTGVKSVGEGGDLQDGNNIHCHLSFLHSLSPCLLFLVSPLTFPLLEVKPPHDPVFPSVRLVGLPKFLEMIIQYFGHKLKLNFI